MHCRFRRYRHDNILHSANDTEKGFTAENICGLRQDTGVGRGVPCFGADHELFHAVPLS